VITQDEHQQDVVNTDRPGVTAGVEPATGKGGSNLPVTRISISIGGTILQIHFECGGLEGPPSHTYVVISVAPNQTNNQD
jgi:hypothetical protein